MCVYRTAVERMNRLFTLIFSLFCAVVPAVAQPAGGTTARDTAVHRPDNRLGEAVVSAGSRRMLRTDSAGRLYWRMESLAEMPHVLGAADPLRELQLLPGVATNADYASGISIQGCEASQSLLHIDGAPVFNASHLLGLFSVFNASHFSTMSLVSNRHDARFANRLGGELAFFPTDTLVSRPHLSSTFSFMESEGTVALPAGRNAALYLSARGSYLNALYGDLLEVDDVRLKYGLQDYNLTYVLQAGGADRLRLTCYYGSDRLELLPKDFDERNDLSWNNIAVVLRHEHRARRLTWHQGATFSRYAARTRLGLHAVRLDEEADILQAGYSGHAEWTACGADWSGGAEYSGYRFTPMHIGLTGSFVSQQMPRVRRHAHEAALHVQARVPFAGRWSAVGGVRLSAYTCGGSTFVAPDPRLTVEYRPAPQHTLSFHYGIYRQFLHRMALAGSGQPVDYWIPADASVRPQRAHSLALGYRTEWARGAWELSAEIYCKQLSHQHEYHGSVLDFVTENYDAASHVIHGRGCNYGLNLMLRKNRGRLTGWVGYALGAARRRFPALDATGWFSDAHDRLHDLSVVAAYRINRHWSTAGNFVYASGLPYTGIKGFYLINHNLVSEYGRHNAARLPATHRLDVALTYRFTPRRGCEQRLNFSVYNLYARRNVLFRYLNVHEHDIGFKDVGSLCRLLPSVGYSLKF